VALPLKRLPLILAVLPALLLVLEASYFVWVLAGDEDLQKADLIIAFEGGYDRVRTAYRLVDQSYAPNLLISPATEKKLWVYEKRFQPSQPYARIMEEKSRTTLENAVYTQRILEDKGFRSAILITSWDHMPRSYFLLRATTFASKVIIQPYPVATGKVNQDNWYRHTEGWKMVYNEMVEFWGSLIELAKYKITGELPEQVPGESTLATRLKQLFLFKIDHRSLHA
jgi:uncharacterized SAM-binding protein YcdF (DUF218 family)